jgi:hypothetical protein
MGEHRAHDPPEGVAGFRKVVVVEVEVLRDPDARSFRARITAKTGRTRRGVVAMFALVLASAISGALWLGNRDASPSLVNVVAGEQGPTGFAAAYGTSPRCLSVKILTIGGTHTQADVNRQTRCGDYIEDPTPIFQYISGTWRPVLDAVTYVCPVASLSARIRTHLDVCLPTRADRLALDR